MARVKPDTTTTTNAAITPDVVPENTLQNSSTTTATTASRSRVATEPHPAPATCDCYSY